jgi:hypothetical protein
VLLSIKADTIEQAVELAQEHFIENQEVLLHVQYVAFPPGAKEVVVHVPGHIPSGHIRGDVQ